MSGLMNLRCGGPRLATALAAGLGISSAALGAANRVLDIVAVRSTTVPGEYTVKALWHVETDGPTPSANVSTLVDLYVDDVLTSSILSHAVVDSLFCGGVCEGQLCGIAIINGERTDMFCAEKDGVCGCRSETTIVDFGDIVLPDEANLRIELSPLPQAVPDADLSDNTYLHDLGMGPIWWDREIRTVSIVGEGPAQELTYEMRTSVVGMESEAEVDLGWEVSYDFEVQVMSIFEAFPLDLPGGYSSTRCSLGWGCLVTLPCPERNGYNVLCKEAPSGFWRNSCFCVYVPDDLGEGPEFPILPPGERVTMTLRPSKGALPELDCSNDSATAVVKACSADQDGDDDVDIFDFAAFGQQFGCPN